MALPRSPRNPSSVHNSAVRATVVFGFYGSKLDQPGNKRWERWRPTVDVCRHEELPIARFELLYNTGQLRDAESTRRDMLRVSPNTEVVLREVPLADPWDFELVFGALHALSRSYEFEPERIDYLVHITTGTHVAQICWFLLTESRHFPARLLQTSPPLTGTRTEPGRYSLIDLDLSRYDGLARRFNEEREQSVTTLKAGIETRNAPFNALIENIERVATRSTEPMLLMGPTGAGKSQLAEQIYRLRRARSMCTGPLVVVNCATIRGDGAMSALFGHVRGSFTGATHDRLGLLRSADAGLLFLDEIGELGLDEQAMLLRAIEDKTFLPVGSEREVKSNFQLIAGTNAALHSAAKRGAFREDLLARINLWTFTLPSLAERKEDIAPNLDFELERCSQKLGAKVTMNQQARQCFLQFATSDAALWTANFRDFGAAVLRMSTLAPSHRIDVATVQEELSRLSAQWQTAARSHLVGDESAARPGSAARPLDVALTPAEWDALDPFERPQLSYALTVCRRARSLSEAGRELFAVSRLRRSSTNDADRLKKYLARFGLSFDALSATGSVRDASPDSI
jgi:transcriptional regulatory protein RtcR